MSDLTSAEQQWHAWIEQACAAVGTDPELVDVREIHALTKEIAHGFSRPMAPVGAYILGLAVGAGGGAVDRAALLAALNATVVVADDTPALAIDTSTDTGTGNAPGTLPATGTVAQSQEGIAS